MSPIYMGDLDPTEAQGGEPLTDNRMPEPHEIEVVTLEQFVEVDEPGAAALLGDEDGALIPENSDVMIYGDGGAGKTTLAIDLACHLASGRAWIGIPVPRPVRVLLIENEGPRALLRRKLRRKLEAWNGSLDGNIRVFERPWGRFTLATADWREELALKAAAWDIDVMIVGPLTRVGMNEAGTLQDVTGFMRLVADMRERSTRALTVVLVHHENKSGAVSGAWEGSGDTLLHVRAAGNGHTIVVVQKARWSSEYNGRTLKLAWTDGEGFRPEGDRDLLAEVDDLLSDGSWRTVRDICAPVDRDGIGANREAVRALLGDHPELFHSRTGEDARAVGRSASATVWGKVAQTLEPPEPLTGFLGVVPGGGSVAPPLREPQEPKPPHLDAPGPAQGPEPPPPCCCADGGGEPTDDGRCSRCFGSLQHDGCEGGRKGGAMRVKCEVESTVLDGDYGNEIESVMATCSRCGQETEAYGTSDASVNRCLLTLREECPRGERNFYVGELG